MPVFGTPIEAWSVGVWTSELCDVSLQTFNSSGDNQWGVLRWFEEGTTDEDEANVRVIILDTNENVLQTGLAGNSVINNIRFNRSIDLSLLTNVKSVDIRVRFKLSNLTAQAVVSNIEMNCNKSW